MPRFLLISCLLKFTLLKMELWLRLMFRLMMFVRLERFYVSLKLMIEMLKLINTKVNKKKKRFRRLMWLKSKLTSVLLR